MNIMNGLILPSILRGVVDISILAAREPAVIGKPVT